MLSKGLLGLEGGVSGKELTCQSRRHKGIEGLITGLERSSQGGHGNSLQYSCLENPMDRGDCQAIIHGVVRVRHGS